MNFPDDRAGTFWTTKVVNNTYHGSWDNGAGSASQVFPKTRYDSKSYRSPRVLGDRVHATFYDRYGARVVSDEPYSFRASGIWGGKYWEHNESIHIGTLLPEFILSPYDLRNTSFPGELGNAESAAVTKLLNKLGDQKLNMGENVGQASQTLNQIMGPLILLLKAYKNARVGNWAGVKALLGPPHEYYNGVKLSNLWLQYYYGWKPLLKDIHAGFDLISSTQPSERKQLKVAATQSFEGKFDAPGGQYDERYRWKARVKAGATIEANNSIGGLLNSVGLVNPLATAWELTPFSFVVDWFLPIGHVLNGLTAGYGFDFVTGYRTTMVEIQHRASARTDPGLFGYYPGLGNPPLVIQSPGLRLTEYKSMTRIPFYTLPMPALYVRDNPFKGARIASALALMRQLF